MSAQIYINNELLDSDAKSGVALSIAANSIADIKDRRNTITNSFRLPLTERNNMLLGYANRTQSLSPHARTRIKNCKIIEDAEYYHGSLIIDKVAEDYQVQFVSGNGEFLKDIEGKKLADLDLSAYDKLWDLTNMNDRYGHADSPAFFIVDDGTLPTGSRSVDVRKQYYSLYFSAIMHEIITQAGWNKTGSLFTDPGYLAMHLPFTNEFPKKQGGIRVRANAINTIYNFTSAGQTEILRFDDDSLTGEDTDNQWTIDPSGTFLDVVVSEEYQFNIALNFDVIEPTPQGFPSYLQIYFVKVDTSGNETTTLLQTIVSSGTFSITHKPILNVIAGERYYVRARLGLGNRQKVLAFHSTSSFSIENDDIMSFGDLWQWKYNLPDIDQKDFFKACLSLTGSVMTTDSLDKTVRCELFTQIAENKIHAPKFDKYIDHDKPSVKSFHPPYAMRNWMRYKEDDHVPKNYGDGYFTISDDSLPAEKELLTLPFAASDSHTTLNNLSAWKVLRTFGGEVIIPEPRVLLAAALDVSGSGNISLHAGGGGISKSFYNYGYFTDRQKTYSLNSFAVFGTYYRHHVILLNNYLELAADTYLTPEILNNLDLFIPVFVEKENAYFIIEKIANHQSGKRSVTTLVRI